MLKPQSPLAGALAALACFAAGPSSGQPPADARHITTADIVELEAFGRAAVSPDGRWGVYEKRGPYSSAPRFDYAVRATWTIMDLWIVDLADPMPTPRRLLPDEGPGLQRMAWSPDSRRLMISRLRDDRIEVGVVTIETGVVAWTGLTPEMPRTGATAQWVSAEEALVSIRPDGSLPAFIRYDSGAQARLAEAWRKSAEGREPSRTVIEADGGLLTAETPTPPGALVVLNARTGAVRLLIEGQITDFAASPDGASVAVTAEDGPASITSGPIVQQESNARQRLSLIRLSDGRTLRPAPGRDIAPALLRWSPDSRSVLVWGRPDGATWSDGDLLRASVEGAEPLELGDLTPGESRQIDTGVRADWIGDSPVIFARASHGARYDWHLLGGDTPKALTGGLTVAPNRIVGAGGDSLKLIADGALWSLDRRGAHRLTPADRTLQGAFPADAEQVFRLTYNEAPRRDWTTAHGSGGETFVFDLKSGLRRLGPGRGSVPRVLAVSPDAALVLERTGLEESLCLRRNGSSACFDAVNSARRDVELIAPVPVRHGGVNGAELVDWLYWPPDRAPEKIRGVIVSVYPGRSDGFVWNDPLTHTYGFRSNVLAAAGFAVLSVGLPADAPPEGRGDTYARAADLAVDAALAAHPELPADRLALFGHSFGGYAAMEIATRSTRYRSYVSSAGMYDMFTAWGETHAATRPQPEDLVLFRNVQGWTEVGQSGMRVPPWEDPDLYLASSPFLRAGNVTAPVLLLTADLDFVPMTQAEKMFSALYRQGKQARLVTYWGEHHHAWSPANIRDRYQQVFDWLDETLPPVLSGPATGGPPRLEPTTQTPPPQ